MGDPVLRWDTLEDAQVDLADIESALATHRPTMVIVSWMPAGTDWTAKIRAAPSVMEYILIGPPEKSLCGNEWLTWGWGGGGRPPHFAVDGWAREFVDDVSRLLLSCVDCPLWDEVGSSRCVSFRRLSSEELELMDGPTREEERRKIDSKKSKAHDSLMRKEEKGRQERMLAELKANREKADAERLAKGH